MGIELSIDEAERRGRRDCGGVTKCEGAGPVFAHFAVVIDCLRVFVQRALERVRNAQARVGKRKQMRLIESLALGNRRQILLVACENQRYLVGVGPDSVGSILAMEAEEGFLSRDGSARGPELVRRRGREANVEARSRAAADAGLELWQ